MSAGVEESGAMVTVGTGSRTDPNVKATVQELYDGLVARGQNAWPSVRFDLGAVNNLLGRFLAAGFYYKTFMGIPPLEWGSGTGMWMRYERIIRKAAPFKWWDTHESLVVKPCRKKTTQQIIHRAEIKTHTGPGILPSCHQSIVQFLHCCLDIGIGSRSRAHCYHRARFFDAGRHYTARSVIFETSTNNPVTVCDQCGRERIA
jgi:hypothetical protein